MPLEIQLLNGEATQQVRFKKLGSEWKLDGH